MKLTGDTTCPGCKKEHKVEFDLDKLNDNIKPQEINNGIGSQQTIVTEKPKIVEKEVIKTVIEDFKPNYECPNGNCDTGVHKNKNYKKLVKGKCTNCDQFTKHDSGTCPWCKGTDIDSIDPEDLQELGIEKPITDEHEGHEHE